jgi:hypothetical protein
VKEKESQFYPSFFQPCINPMTTNIDVCCRDPNYTDPWPDMDNSGNGNGKAGNFVGNGNAGKFNNNNGNNNAGIVPRFQAQESSSSQQVVRKGSSYGK